MPTRDDPEGELARGLMIVDALSEDRAWLRRVLSDPYATVVVVEHRDRLAQFELEHLEATLSAQGRRTVVADLRENLARDMIEVLTSMCACLYGRPGARNRAMRGVTATNHLEPASGLATV